MVRLFRARGRSAKADGFKTPIRRRVKLRYIRDALRGRASLIPLRCPLAHRRGIAIPGPFGSANRAASSKPARFFRRWRRFAAFLFPTKPASLGFCGVPLSVEKENAPFDGVREKGSGGGIPDFVRNARSALYGGLARQSSEVLPSVSALDRNGTPGPARMLCRPLFAAAPWHSRKRSRPHCQSSATTGLRQQKRSRERPGAPPTYGTAMHG